MILIDNNDKIRKNYDTLKEEGENRMKSAEKSAKMLEYIREFTTKNGYAPSVREISAALGIKSTSTVFYYINKLADQGLLEKATGKNRALSVIGVKNQVSVPVLGQVAAGKPILALENVEGYVSVEARLAKGAELFALNVKGDSMIECGIYNGDTVIVRKQPNAQNGEIVVAMIEDEATVKRFFKENGRFRLQPENSSMRPIITDDVFILGKVIAVVRYFE